MSKLEIVVDRNRYSKRRKLMGMKKSAIAKVIKNKMTDWLKSIKDEALAKEVAENYIVTGGCITSMLLGEEVNDYDVYLQRPEVAVRLAQYYLEGAVRGDKVSKIEVRQNADRVKIFIKSAGVMGEDKDPNANYEYFEITGGDISSYLDKTKFKKNYKAAKGYQPVMITDNAISLSNDVQVILRFIGNPEEIHKNFDFAHTTNFFTPQTGLVLNQKALEAILAKELIYVGSLYPICSVFRLRKFIKRGWSVSAGEILKMAWDISKLDLEDIDVLREQLIGVDVCYMNELLHLIKSEGKDLTRSYLVDLIQRVWDENDPEIEIVEEITDDEND